MNRIFNIIFSIGRPTNTIFHKSHGFTNRQIYKSCGALHLNVRGVVRQEKLSQVIFNIPRRAPIFYKYYGFYKYDGALHLNVRGVVRQEKLSQVIFNIPDGRQFSTNTTASTSITVLCTLT